MTARAAVTRRAPGNTTGRELTQPCSLPAATSDPEKVMGPMRMSSTVAIITWVAMPAPLVSVIHDATITTARHRDDHA
jgi:hypothetical protein